jgi:hypothetical protein
MASADQAAGLPEPALKRRACSVEQRLPCPPGDPSSLFVGTGADTAPSGVHRLGAGRCTVVRYPVRLLPLSSGRSKLAPSAVFFYEVSGEASS